MAKCNQLTPLPFKGLIYLLSVYGVVWFAYSFCTSAVHCTELVWLIVSYLHLHWCKFDCHLEFCWVDFFTPSCIMPRMIPGSYGIDPVHFLVKWRKRPVNEASVSLCYVSLIIMSWKMLAFAGIQSYADYSVIRNGNLSKLLYMD